MSDGKYTALQAFKGRQWFLSLGVFEHKDVVPAETQNDSHTFDFQIQINTCKLRSLHIMHNKRGDGWGNWFQFLTVL